MPRAPSDPQVSVLLPVYNAGGHLAAALRSLAAQRGVRFEVVAIDDGSSDGSGEALRAASREHAWLRVLGQERRGVARALNRAIAESRAPLLARMDADDIAAPDRLRVQRDFLARETEVGVCGSAFRLLGEARGVVRVPMTDAAIRARLVFGSAFAHPAVMLRRNLLIDESAYDPADEGFEDYALWLRLAARTRFCNLRQALLGYRVHAGQVTARRDAGRTARLERLRLTLLERCGLEMSEAERRAHEATGFEANANAAPLPTIGTWLERLAIELPRAGWCETAPLQRECGEAWWRCNRTRAGGAAAAWRYWCQPIASRSPRSAWRALRLALGTSVAQTGERSAS